MRMDATGGVPPPSRISGPPSANPILEPALAKILPSRHFSLIHVYKTYT